MNRVILKYPISITGATRHDIPEGSFLCDVQVQNGVPTMWWSVPRTGVASKERTFVVETTGSPNGYAGLHYVGTFQTEWFVGHVLSSEPVQRYAP